MTRKILSTIAIAILFQFSTLAQTKKHDLDTLIGKIFTDFVEIGNPHYFIGYLLDPTSTEYAVDGLRFNKTSIFIFTRNVGEDSTGKKWEILDILIAPKKGYFDHWCCRLIENDSFDRESIAFLKKRRLSKYKVLKMYHADRTSKKFIEFKEANCYRKNFVDGRGFKY
jgi:hypothetical protein